MISFFSQLKANFWFSCVVNQQQDYEVNRVTSGLVFLGESYQLAWMFGNFHSLACVDKEVNACLGVAEHLKPKVQISLWVFQPRDEIKISKYRTQLLPMLRFPPPIKRYSEQSLIINGCLVFIYGRRRNRKLKFTNQIAENAKKQRVELCRSDGYVQGRFIRLLILDRKSSSLFFNENRKRSSNHSLSIKQRLQGTFEWKPSKPSNWNSMMVLLYTLLNQFVIDKKFHFTKFTWNWIVGGKFLLTVIFSIMLWWKSSEANLGS